MRIAMFYHSLVSDWNHGNAHFLRGIASELVARGHDLQIFEPADGWSRSNMLSEAEHAIEDFNAAFPGLQSICYNTDSLHLEKWLDGVDLVIVHEWNDPGLVDAIGEHRKRAGRLRALFHDTHHRALTAQNELSRFDLSNYDGVLAYGASLKDAYQRLGWGQQVHVWHEAADTRVFYPRSFQGETKDVVWIGNWGDDERTPELREYLLQPIKALHLRADIYGVRYPQSALQELQDAGMTFSGWLPNYRAPQVFAEFKATVHVPRRPYVEHLPGIPTIRPFEALACGIPLVSAPWRDSEGLFRIGRDFLMAQDGQEMTKCLHAVINDADLRASLVASGLDTIRSRHTCSHRVDELLAIYEGLSVSALSSEEVIEK